LAARAGDLLGSAGRFPELEEAARQLSEEVQAIRRSLQEP